MTSSELRAKLRSILSAYVDVPSDDDAALELDSLSVVRLIEELEDTLNITVRAADATPENFHSIAALNALIRAKLS